MSDESPTPEFDPARLFNECPPEPSTACLIFNPAQEQVIGRSTPAVFMLRDTVTRHLIYQGLTFIAPPVKFWTQDASATFELLVGAGGIAEGGRKLGRREYAHLKAMFRFVRCESLKSRELLYVVEAAGDSQFIFLPCATLYQGLLPHSGLDTDMGLRLDEDAWVQETAKLAQKLIVLSEQKGNYVLMTSNVEPPKRAANKERLLDIQNFFIAGLGEHAQQVPMALLKHLTALAKSGRAEEALAQLQAEELPELIKRQIQMQIAHRSGDSATAARMIRSLWEGIPVTGTMAAQWAKICLEGGDRATARDLIDSVLDKILQQHALETCLEMATTIHDVRLLHRAWERLNGLFPDSSSLQLNCELRLLQVCRQTAVEAQAHPVPRIGFSAYHTLLADKLHAEGEINYSLLLQEFDARWPEHRELSAMCAIAHAMKSGEIDELMSLSHQLIPNSRFSSMAAGLVLQTLRQLFLEEAIGPDGLAIYGLFLEILVIHLGHHPRDTELRADLVRTISVEAAGRDGLALMTAVAFAFADRMPEPSDEQSSVDPAATGHEFGEFLERLGPWLDQNSVLDPTASLPSAVVGSNAAGLSRLMREGIQQCVSASHSLQELEEAYRLGHLLPPLTRHVPGSSDDIHALRVLAGGYALHNDYQRARDLSELILMIAGNSLERKRLAWSAFADIYQRSHIFADALLGLACAGATQARLPANDLYQEAYTLMRIARDRGHSKRAERLLEACRRLCVKAGMSDITCHRLDVVGLQLRVSMVQTTDLPSLSSLLNDCQRCLKDAIAFEDESHVAASLLAQVSGMYERAGGQVSAEVAALQDETLDTLGPEAASTLRTLGAARPAPVDLVALHNKIGHARYAHDGPSDTIGVNLVARRLLRPSMHEISPQEAFLAIELLADRGLTLPTPPVLLTPEWPTHVAESLAQQHKLSVLMLALDDEAQLVAAIADPTGTYVVRPPRASGSVRDRLLTWSKTYPFSYGLIEPRKTIEQNPSSARTREVGDQEFYKSMREFSIPMPQDRRVLVVAEPELAQLTFNLVLGEDGELLGYGTVIGIVPSLTWLASVRQQALGCNGRRIAWISHEGAPTELRAMYVVKAMIEETLSRHAISLDTSNALPQAAQGAQLAIVTAHGQLARDEKYFRRIQDEENLRESPLALAQALAGTELVILLICSGGRIDRHPTENTTVGLPKMLLNNGCRTVIAPPWPLESLAAGPWLHAFLEHWDKGATAMDACFQANSYMAKRREREPQVSLAMTVYGDPLLVRPSTT